MHMKERMAKRCIKLNIHISSDDPQIGLHTRSLMKYCSPISGCGESHNTNLLLL